jgi:predicted Zn-dependent protease
MFRKSLAVLFLAAAAAHAQLSAPNSDEASQSAIERVLADFDAKKYDDALAKLEELQKARPDDPLVLNLIGSVYTKKQNYQKAERHFRESLERQPGFFPAQYNLGELLFLQEKYPAAREHFQTMRASDSRNELLQFKVGLCDLQAGEIDRARRVMNAIKYPGDSPAWYYGQAALANKEGNITKARGLVRSAKFVYGPEKTALFDETFENLGLDFK